MLRFSSLVLILLFSISAWGQAGSSYEFGSPYSGTIILRCDDRSINNWSSWHSNMLRTNYCGEAISAFNLGFINHPNASSSKYITMPDHGYVFAFQEVTFGGIGTKIELFLCRTDSLGQVLWANQYYFANEDYSEHYPTGLMLSEKGVILLSLGYEISNGTQWGHGIAKIKATDGHVLSFMQYSYSQKSQLSMCQMPDGGLIWSTYHFLARTDSTGQMLWHVSQNPLNSGGYETDIVVTNSAIYSLGSTPANQLTLSKLDLQGQLVWQYQYLNLGSPVRLWSNSRENLVAVVRDPNQGFRIVEIDSSGQAIRTGQGNVEKYVVDACSTPTDETIISLNNNSNESRLVHLFNDLSWYCETQNTTVVRNTYSDPYIPAPIISIPKNLLKTPVFVQSGVVTPEKQMLCVPPPLNLSVDLGDDIYACRSSVKYLKSFVPVSNANYSWSTGEVTDSILPTQSGKYWLNLMGACGQILASDTVVVTLFGVNSEGLGPDLEICPGEELKLELADCSSCSFIWNDGSTNNSISVQNEGLYWLEFTDNQGCSSTDTVEVFKGECDWEIFVPTAFTPNKDGLNENIRPFIRGAISSYLFQVYNRSDLVFQSTDPLAYWHGKFNERDCPQGVYQWRLICQFDGIKETIEKRGRITLIR